MEDTIQGPQFQENMPLVLPHLSFRTDNFNYIFLGVWVWNLYKGEMLPFLTIYNSATYHVYLS